MPNQPNEAEEAEATAEGEAGTDRDAEAAVETGAAIQTRPFSKEAPRR
jgi:hypothetical protein